ncbi:MAG: hypothetical protein KUL88_01275 [Rhizobium sp.]|nr:hypothetical protein [Rhizobium sp.]
MSWLGDVASFESFNFGKMAQQIGKNPLRLAYGSADPFSTNVWNKILGTNDKPLIDQYGGAAPQRYEEAKQAGINTGPGATMHGIARTIASMYAGGALGKAAGGMGSAGGQGASTLGQGSNGLLEASQVNLGNSGYLMNGSVNPAMATQGGSQASTGILGQFGTAVEKYKPIVDAAKTGMNMSQMFDRQEQPIMAQPPQQYGNPGPQVLAELANAGQASSQGILAQADQERKARRAQRRGIL